MAIISSVELFAGAGGLALGASLAGVSPKAVIEWNKDACATLKANQQLQNPLMADWPLYEGDVRDYDFTRLNNVDIVAGGPPCQPFSLGGKHKGHNDKRDMFPAAIDVVRKMRPKAFLFENVKGLARSAFINYLQYTLLQLAFPEILKKENENWLEHLARLKIEKISGKSPELSYDVAFKIINAADYGIPQKRERLFIIGFRRDLDVSWSFPKPTHSLEELLRDQWITGEYWEKHRVCRKYRPPIDTRSKMKLLQMGNPLSLEYTLKPWRTVRDAIAGLPEPYLPDDIPCMSSRNFLNHEYQSGARFYKGHTGSSLDLPAKTIKAGSHGVPGGENMLVDLSGNPRYFTVRESARLQSFPDDYVFQGSWTESMRQLGNAVPVKLAYLMISRIVEKILPQSGA